MATSGVKVVRRNRPGTKAKDLCGWPPQDFSDMESTLAVQQYIQQLIHKDYRDIEAILQPPNGQDEAVWKYEHLRQFCNEMNGLAVMLQNECNPSVCTQMTATEQWIFLCAAHKNPQECSAVDYTLHTLHGAASLLNSNKYFPSRITIKETSIPRLSSVARRIYRIFSHAYFHHRTLYDQFEEETCLCVRFTRYVLKYGLMTPENLNVPIEGSTPDPTPSATPPSGAKGEEEEEEEKASEGESQEVKKEEQEEVEGGKHVEEHGESDA